LSSSPSDFSEVPRRLSDQIANYLRNEIYAGRLLPGERLLEVELCERLSVSRAPLREALLTLQNDQLIDVRPHRGASVIRLSEDDIRELFVLRRQLEPLAARAMAERAEQPEIDALRASLAALKAAIESPDRLAISLSHAEFHRAIGRASGLRRLAAFIDTLCTQMLAWHGVGTLDNPAGTDDLAGHVAIVEAIAAHDGDRAEQAMREHFQPVDPMIESYRRLLERAASAAE
jgi:DNA-binding GntR family transcriptional regulator